MIQIIKPFKILPKPWGNETWLYSGEGETDFLLKIIRADQPLSVQVHPPGKSESWVVLEASGPDACLYLGFSKPQTREEFAKLAGQPGEKFLPALNRLSVKPGEVFDVPAGWIHAIGGGVVLLEIQQVSDVTYRIWDWGRTSREMHVDKALDVLDFSAVNPIRLKPEKIGASEEILVSRPEAGYALNRLAVPAGGVQLSMEGEDRDAILVLVKDAVQIDGIKVMPGACVHLPKKSKKFALQAADSPQAILYKAYKP